MPGAGNGHGEGEAHALADQQVLARRDRELARQRQILEATITNLRTEFELVEDKLHRVTQEEAQ